MKGDVLSEPGRFGPLAADNPSVGNICGICETPLVVGDRPALAEIGPADEEEAVKAAAGRAYNAEAAVVHERCTH